MSVRKDTVYVRVKPVYIRKAVLSISVKPVLSERIINYLASVQVVNHAGKISGSKAVVDVDNADAAGTGIEHG